MEIKLRPLGKRILVQPEVVEEKTKGGLYIPDNAQDDKRSQSGKVLKLGTAPSDKFLMKEGDIVYFKKYSTEEITLEDQKYLVIHIDDVIAIQ